MNYKNARILLTVLMSLGLVLGAGQAFATIQDQEAADAKAEQKVEPVEMKHTGHTKNEMSPSRKPVADTWITTKVKADLLATDGVSGTDVKVKTINGVVKLSGNVKSESEHEKAVDVAKGIEGVKRVDASKLKVRAETSN